LATQWRIALLYLRQDYEGVVRLADGGYAALIERGADASFLADRLVRSLVRIRRLERAVEVANDHWMRSNNPLLQAVVVAASGDVVLTRQWLRYCVEYGYATAAFYEDDLLAPALTNDAFAAVRGEFPREPQGTQKSGATSN
jgi:hypothetical protein